MGYEIWDVGVRAVRLDYWIKVTGKATGTPVQPE